MTNARDAIRSALKKPGKTQTGLATALNRAPSVVTALLKGERQLKADELPIVARYLELPVSDLVAEPQWGLVRMVKVRGYVQAGHWAEAWELPEEDRFEVPVLNEEEVRRFALFGLETRGPSMNLQYPEGTIIICTDVIERGEQLLEGRRYIIERERADGLREATVKKLQRDDSGGLWLVPESSDPRFQAPIPLTGAEGDTIRIVGRVVGSYRREP